MYGKNLLKVFERECYRTTASELFRSFVDRLLQRFAVPNLDLSAAERYPDLSIELEKLFWDEIQRVRPLADVMGEVYMGVANRWHSQAMGQYFTPEPICDMMAAMTLGDDLDGVPDRLASCLDPACGSGAMLLASMRRVREGAGEDALRRWCFVGVDVDGTCARMAAAQLLVHCAVHGLSIGEVVIVHGDSLVPDRRWEPVLHASAVGVASTINPHSPTFVRGLARQVAGSDTTPTLELSA